jgi:hypothetical protein
MRFNRPISLRAGFERTAMRSVPVFESYGMPDWVRRDELRRRLFRVLYPKADQRVKGPRSREAALWLNERR